MAARSYSVTVEHPNQGFQILIESYPRDYLTAHELVSTSLFVQHLGLQEAHEIYNLADRVGADSSQWLTWLVLHLLRSPDTEWLYTNLTARNPLFSSVLQDLAEVERFGGSGEQLTPFISEVVNAPIIAVEQSDPSMKALAEVASIGGGAGLGVMVASGVLGPAAIFIVPSGIIVVTVGKRLARRLGRWVDSPERRIKDWRKMLDAGDITEDEYRQAVRTVMDEDTRPSDAEVQ